MWHEARKQEKLIKGLIVDYRRRAERRRDFYEKIKADPTQFLQIHGRPCKIHLDPAIAAAGESPAIMMPWQGDPDNMIDRFDVRAHLDYIPNVPPSETSLDELSHEERHCNYERYRILAQNMFLGIAEEKFLHQLNIEEKYGVTLEEKEAQRDKQSEKKGTGVAIGFNYDGDPQCPPLPPAPPPEEKNDSDQESDNEMIDVDLSIDVNKIEMAQAHMMNSCGCSFGMPGTDLFSFLTGDAEEAEKNKQLMREEKEKALFSGRKSRRERRAHRDKKLALRVVSPPHYAAKPPSPRPLSPSPTRSPSPSKAPHTDKITFITSFGGDEEQHHVSPERPTPVKSKTYASVLKDGRKRLRTPSPKKSRKSPVKRQRSRFSSSHKSRSRSRSISKKSQSYSRSPSRSRSRSRGQLKSLSRSNSRSKSRSYSRKRSRSSRSSRSRSRSRSRRSSSRSSRSSYNSYEDRKTAGSSSKHPSGKTTADGPASGDKSRIPRYYGRKRDGIRSSSSELSVDSQSDQDSDVKNSSRDKMIGGLSNIGNKSGAPTKQAKERLTAKERLKRKMQAQLSRQLRADLKAEAEKQEREQMMQQERDDEMRELAIKIRRRQRELRHQRYSQSSNDGSSSPHHSRRSPKCRSRDHSSEEESPKQNEKLQERASPERHRKSRSSSKSRSSTREHEPSGRGYSSSRHYNTSEWRGESRSGRNYPDNRGNYREGNYEDRPQYASGGGQSRSYSRYCYRREDDGRGGPSERGRDQDHTKGRYGGSRRDYQEGGHASYSGGGEGGARRDRDVIKYSDRKLVDY